VAVSLDRVRRGFYMDSAALMRLSQALSELPGSALAAFFIGAPRNTRLLADAGLLGAAGREAGADDLVIAVRAAGRAEAEAALALAEARLDQPAVRAAGIGEYRPRSLDAALRLLPGANIALVSVPGDFAAAEARKALRRGLHVMVFSDNVPLAEERALKEEAGRAGLLMMGPDCGSAIIAGAPLGFANALPRGSIGIIAASGTGLQEVACLVARGGEGISHAIGVGGRDLAPEIGGLTTLAAIAALDADPATRAVILVSKPPAPEVARAVLDRVAASAKPFVVCFLGVEAGELPANARAAATLRDAALLALGRDPAPPPTPVRPAAPGQRWIRGLYSGGTLCAEAQVVLRRAGESCFSNAPIPGAALAPTGPAPGHLLLDLGADEYTIGRPHAIIDPAMRLPHLAAALADPSVAVILLDIVLGYGAHRDPAGAVAGAVRAAGSDKPVVAALCGTEQDPQGFAGQAAALRAAGIVLAGSNAEAAETALAMLRGAR
jgi:FdrA protein